MFILQYQNRQKRKSGNKFSWSQNGAIRGLHVGAGFRDYKSWQEELQIEAALAISNRIRNFKFVQNTVSFTQSVLVNYLIDEIVKFFTIYNWIFLLQMLKHFFCRIKQLSSTYFVSVIFFLISDPDTLVLQVRLQNLFRVFWSAIFTKKVNFRNLWVIMQNSVIHLSCKSFDQFLRDLR